MPASCADESIDVITKSSEHFLMSIKNILCIMWKKELYNVFRQKRFRSTCTFAQYEQGLYCPFTESLDVVDHIDKQRRS